MQLSLINFAYLVASALFIAGLKGLAHPRTAVRGNLMSAVGMLLAFVVTLVDRRILSYEMIVAGLIIGAAIGAVLALKIQMTAMPQMVALLNGFGGGASVLVAAAALAMAGMKTGPLDNQFTVATAASGIIGTVTFWGSLVAFAKLQELMSGNAILFTGQQVLNAFLGAVILAIAVWLVNDPRAYWNYWLLVAIASVLGILLVIPIGGADMPVVIALLNSYSGLAATATGFVLNNNILIIAGSLVGASGIILTRIMCKAMNRSMTNVLFGVLGPVEGQTATADEVYEGKIKSVSSEEAAMVFDTARKVAIVPGYGMAVAQAQHAVRDLAELLESKGAEVLYGIHPVAGRMPGHMNVLLAEANVPYDQLREMDQINPFMEQIDVALIIGANDTVNPVARSDPSSPIAGMPIIDVDKARTVIVIKRSLSPGFAGIPNPLFALDNTLMYFGDGQEAVLDLISAIKES